MKRFKIHIIIAAVLLTATSCRISRRTNVYHVSEAIDSITVVLPFAGSRAYMKRTATAKLNEAAAQRFSSGHIVFVPDWRFQLQEDFEETGNVSITGYVVPEEVKL